MSVVLDFNTVDQFVSEQNERGSDVRWDGWTLVFFRKSRDNKGYLKPFGAFRKGNWGFETRVAVDNSGKWRVPSRNVKHS